MPGVPAPLPRRSTAPHAGVAERPPRQIAGAAAAQAHHAHGLAVSAGRSLGERLGPGPDHRRHPHRGGPVAIVPPDAVAASDPHLG